MNKSPAKFQDGIQIVNLGGIAGGQILGKDVMIAMEDDIQITRNPAGRRLAIPQIKFLRYTRMTPTVTMRKESILPISGNYLPLGLKKNEHLIHIKLIEHPKFLRNVGRDGELTDLGDYKLGTPKKIFFNIANLSDTSPVIVHYSVRVDKEIENRIDHTLPEDELTIPDGMGIVYLEEIPLDEISEHDTAAMSPRTNLVLRFALLSDYDYSADRYIVAVITEDDHVAQYVKVNKYHA